MRDNFDIVLSAYEIAARAHRGQKRRKGGDYFQEHLIPVGDALVSYGPLYEAVGFLHDVLEDTDMTSEQLHAELGGGPRGTVVLAVETLTKRNGENYDDYLRRVIAHPLAATVKRADIQNNLAALEREHPDPKDHKKAKDKYRVALLLLEVVLSKRKN